MAIAAKGGLQLVVTALTRHQHSSSVASHGCWALRNMTANSTNKIKAEACGAVEAILRVMKVHPHNATVQQQVGREGREIR